MAIDLSIVIVNWNSRDFLRRCLESLERANVAGFRHEIVVIDSGSFDGTGELLRVAFPFVRFVQSNTNIGFAKANNVAAESASGDYLFFLNPDTEVSPGALQELWKQVRQLPRVGIVGARLLNTDGTLQRSCVQPMPTISNQLVDIDILQKYFARFGPWLSAQTYEGSTQSVSVPAVSGASMLIPRAVFTEVGGFSVDYFMYAEDLDLCWKVWRSGYVIYYCAGADIIHHGGGSTRKSRNRFAEIMIPQSLMRLLTKARGGPYGTAYRVALTVAAAVRVSVLVLFCPIVIVAFGIESWKAMLGKWGAVLRWGIGLEAWARKHHGAA